MIEIVTDKDRNLKNIKQIGTPREENKIYIENHAYSKIKEIGYTDKKVFVLMGHTERMEGRYATFVEAVIPVKDIEFSGNIPHWNNGVWKDVFSEIKRLYEEMIIVGWAIDIKGLRPRVTPELERVHREHFGGVHQLLFLMDTLEQEEVFYIYKENKMVSKDGFYIYHRARKKENVQTEPAPIEKRQEKKKSDVKVDVEFVEEKPTRGGTYRQMLQEQKTPKEPESGNMGLAIAVAMLIFVIGVGIYENRGNIFNWSQAVEANVDQETISTENGETSTSSEKDIETLIPVEVISGEGE